MLKFLRSEPVAIQTAIQASLSLIAAFGFHISGEQVAAINAVAAALLALFVRANVTPNSKLP